MIRAKTVYSKADFLGTVSRLKYIASRSFYCYDTVKRRKF